MCRSIYILKEGGKKPDCTLSTNLLLCKPELLITARSFSHEWLCVFTVGRLIYPRGRRCQVLYTQTDVFLFNTGNPRG